MNEFDCKCGGKVADGEPHCIPLGEDKIIIITDMKCNNCGCVYVGGKYQKLKTVKNKEQHDKLVILLESTLHK